MTTDSIQTDLSQEQEKQERQPSPRELMLRHIEEQVDRAQGTEPAQPQGGTSPAAATQADAEQAADEPRVIAADDLGKVKIKVNIGGHDVEKSVADVLAELSTANGRLRQTAQQLKESEARERNRTQREQVTQAPSPEDAPGLKEALDALVEGDTDSAAKVLTEMIGQGRQQATPQVDENAIAERVRQNIETQQAVHDFFTKNPDFAGEYDPQNGIDTRTPQRKMGDYLFDTKYAPRIERGEVSYQQALNDCADEVRTVFSPPPAQMQETKGEKAPSREERQARKEAIDRIPVAASARAVVTPAQEEEDESRAQVIANMRKARGLPA